MSGWQLVSEGGTMCLSDTSIGLRTSLGAR